MGVLAEILAFFIAAAEQFYMSMCRSVIILEWEQN